MGKSHLILASLYITCCLTTGSNFLTKLTAKGLRIVDKKGIDTVLTEIRARGEKV
jgi:ribosomal protein L28